MAESERFGWRLPDGTSQPVVHVDMSNLAADIEDTMYKTPQLVAGFPKFAGPSDVSGWKVNNLLTVYKWKLGENHFKYEFSGLLMRASTLTVSSGSGGTVTISNILDTDVNITGHPSTPNSLFVPTVCQGAGSVFGGVQVAFAGRNIQVRSTGGVTLSTSIGISINNYIAYSTV